MNASRPTFVSPPQLSPAPYEYAAVTPAGSAVFTAGACPIDRAGIVVDPGDLEAQTRLALQNLRLTLAACGADYSHLVKTTVLVATSDRRDLVRVWEVYESAVAPHRPPSTLVGVTVLGYAGQRVEIEAVAAVGSASER
jgi:enamine deaminase RidA (YjgF/YER057c/UK114 family)